jgi:aryl-alcohol dehydrogenase-like predicted oxidoreductase
MDSDRRDFLKQTALFATLAASQGILPSVLAAAPTTPANPSDMIYRTLGRTGEKISAIGLGGAHLGIPKNEQDAIRLIRTAIDRGITFMDNSWDYHNGESERRLGKALRDGYRNKVFLMTKFDGRTKAAAAQQIDESLKRLQTDHRDLLQVHEVIRLEDPDRVFAPGGAIEALLDARKTGKTRYVGFTGHKDPFVHLRMLDTAAKHNFRFDAVQMPLNPLDAHFRSFHDQVLPILVREQIGVLGMKPLANGIIPQNNIASTADCLHYALTLPTSTVITGMESLQALDRVLDAVRTFKPLTPDQITALLARTAQAAATGRYEPFKTNTLFDSTAHHPEWLG